jgi:outer membrane protein OmpA-like peptidoglycan-associated protein
MAQTFSNKLDSLWSTYHMKQAGKAFDNMAYSKAVRKYDKYYLKGVLPDSLKSQLALAYLKIGETVLSEQVYNAMAPANKTANDVFFYAQALKYNGKYAEADRWMEKYLAMNDADSRGHIQQNALPTIEKIKSVERYLIDEVDFNTEGSDFGAWQQGNMVVFASDRKVDYIIRREYAWKETPYLNVFEVKDNGDSYSSPQLFSTRLRTKYHDGPLCFNQAGDEVFITRNVHTGMMPQKTKDGYNHLQIWHAKRDVDGEWGQFKKLPFNGDTFSCAHAFLTKDEQQLYFASDRPGSIGGADIYVVTKEGDSWSEPINMGQEINTEGEEMFPYLDESGVLYFASNGHLGLGGLDLFMANKQSNGKYQVKNMGYPINSEKDDFGLFLKQDGINGFFASNREGGAGDDDIYKFKILKNIDFKKHLVGVLRNQQTKQLLPQVKVSLKDELDQVVASQYSNEVGLFRFEVDEIKDFEFVVEAEGYYPLRQSLDVNSELNQIELNLIPIPVYGIYGKVYLLPDNTPIPNVTLSLEASSGERLNNSSNGDGLFKTKLSKDTEYEIVLKKKGFFSKRIRYSTVGRDTGYVNLNEYMELELQQAELGATMEIQILYDLGKWNIREDAAKELDDMIQFMVDNPSIKIELGSHTDARGSARSNQVLSQKRAESAVQYMVEKGIASDRIVAKGYGETQLKNKCADGVPCSEEEHQANRRSEVKIIAM